MVLAARPTRANVSEDLTRDAILLNALASAQRLHILSLLSKQDGTIHVAKLVEALGLDQPTVSHHIKTLNGANLLFAERHGLYTYYRINRETLTKAIEVIDNLLESRE